MIRLHCDWARRSGATDATLHHRRGNLRRLGERLPCDLLDATPAHLETWQSNLLRADLSLSTIATYTTHAVTFYRWAVDAGHLDVDPSARLPRTKVPRRRPRPIPEPELTILLDTAAEPLRTWLLLAGYMGLRAHEIAQIRRDDVHDRGGRMFLTGVGKGRTPYTMAVPAQVVPYLAAHLRVTPGPLWTAPRGGRLRPDRVTLEATRLMRALGMHHTLHALRHRFGTKVYDLTKNLLVTQHAMRHSSSATTLLYVAISNTETTAAIDRLARSLRRPPSRGKPPGRDEAA
ncbi:MAG: site-specific integrase [Propionibacteriales bacterium]|nr:site-specific integrase [Propionibacteriales bacterium]